MSLQDMSSDTRRALVSRYSRQMLVAGMQGYEGQLALHNSSVVVVGAGGIGSSVLLYLAGAGVGKIGIVDFDVVEISNLHRQVIHDSANVGINKAVSAAQRLAAYNPTIKITPIQCRVTCENALEVLSGYDIIVDASDNFAARYTLNDAAHFLRVPLISGSAVGVEGQITVFDGTGPCYRCLYPNPSAAEGCRSCANAGVLGPVPGLVGTYQAIEVIKLLTNRSKGSGSSSFVPLIGRQLYIDGLTSECSVFDLPPKNANCAICSASPSITSMKDSAQALQTPPCAPMVLSDDHRVSAQEYAEVLRQGTPHVLLDVRSDIQFNMISLADALCSSATLHHIPFAELSKWKKIVSFPGSAETPIYVLCRRGNHSVLATMHLLSLRIDRPIFNVNGGLQAWSETVDVNFPIY